MQLCKSAIYNDKKCLEKTESVYISIGENCLADDILKRFNLKSFSSPYASSRSNIEYILQFERLQFKSFLNPTFLVPSEMYGKPVVRNNKYVETENHYNSSLINGFEFTHHNVLQPEHNETFRRRCNRMLFLRKKKIHMLYHHRYCKSTDLSLLTLHLSELKDIYSNRDNQVYIYCFFQSLVKNEAERRIEKQIINGIYVYQLYTMNIWGGGTERYFLGSM